MVSKRLIGGFEQLVLLAVARLGSGVTALDVARELETCSGRSVSRGALYTTFQRLERRGLLAWEPDNGDAIRDGIPRRLFSVTPAGVEVLRYTREILLNLWEGNEEILGGQNS